VMVIAWYLYLQLSMQSIPITTDIVSSNHDKDEVTTLCNTVLSVTCDRSVVFSGFLHNIIEILLNTIKQTNKHKNEYFYQKLDISHLDITKHINNTKLI